MKSLDGKTVLITGATGGIGKTAALLFGQEAAQVIVAGRRASQGEAVAEDIVRAGGEAMYVQVDVTQPSSVESAIAAATRRFGKIDVLFNNAGGSSNADDRVTDVPLEEFWRVVKLDLFGTFLCCRYAIPELAKRGRSSIVNNASIVGLTIRGS